MPIRPDETGPPGASDVQVRPGTEPDAQHVASLHADNITEGFLRQLGHPFLVRLYRRIVRSSDSFLIVAESAGERVGFVAGAMDLGALYRRFAFRDGPFVAAVAGRVLVAQLPRAIETLRHGIFARARTEEARRGPKTPVSNAKDAELLSIAVDPRARGRGTGSVLVDAFVAEARARGARSARVVVAKDNKDAVSLYRRAGFEEAEEFELHPGTKSLLMRQELRWR
jgi:ribosomal protein S18 acetylase RimI-like enzyme